MRTLLVLAALALLSLAPAATSSHAGCGGSDGQLLLNGLHVWLAPGCEGVALVIDGRCADVIHADVLGTTVVVLEGDCVLVGFWLR